MKGVRRPLDLCFWFGAALACGGMLWAFWPVSAIDRNYYPRVHGAPGRRWAPILFDEAHWNSDTAIGRYAPFVLLLRRDGYRVSRNKQEIVPELLTEYKVLIVVNGRSLRGALGMSGGEAFDAAEIDSVREWVRGGGGLLLVTDPEVAGASRSLAAAFGIAMSGTVAAAQKAAVGEHPIIAGREERDEALRRVDTYRSQTLSGATPLLQLPDGRAYAVALQFGKGRVVAVGDSAALTALPRQGIARRDNHNQQFVLNTLHWLSGVM